MQGIGSICSDLGLLRQGVTVGISVILGVPKDVESLEESPEEGILVDLEDLLSLLQAMFVSLWPFGVRLPPTDVSVSKWR